MNEFLEKLSSYNIFNYLLPGTLFSFAAEILTQYKLIQDDLLIGVFLYYFIGLIVSRVGSILIEPLLKFIKLVEFVDYEDYIRATKSDELIEILSESNNMFRTIISMFICLLILFSYEALVIKFPSFIELTPYVLIILLIIIFALSYKKQSGYIVKRVKAASKTND